LALHDTTHEPSRKKFIILVQFTRFGKIEVNLPGVLCACRRLLPIDFDRIEDRRLILTAQVRSTFCHTRYAVV